MKIVNIYDEKLSNDDSPVKRSIAYLLDKYPEFRASLFNMSVEQHQAFDCVFAQENRCRVVCNADGWAEKIVWNDRDYSWFLLRWA